MCIITILGDFGPLEMGGIYQVTVTSTIEKENRTTRIYSLFNIKTTLWFIFNPPVVKIALSTSAELVCKEDSVMAVCICPDKIPPKNTHQSFI